MPRGSKGKRQNSEGTNYHKMTKEERSTASKRLFGDDLTNKGSEEVSVSVDCNSGGCVNKAVQCCPYCNRFFCSQHISPTLVMPHPNRWPRDDPDLLRLYEKEWSRINVHPCPPYTQKKLAEIRTKPTTTTWRRPSQPNRGWREQPQPEYYAPRATKYAKSRTVSSKTTGKFILIILLLFLLFAFWNPVTQIFSSAGSAIQNTTTSIGTSKAGLLNLTTQSQTSTVYQSTPKNNISAMDAYALYLINLNRHQYGLKNVTLSSIPSAQQHAESMLQNSYMSHWDIYAMKPYMRYTLLNGTGSVSENIAYQFGNSCIDFIICTGTIDTKSALEQMEHNFIYNDTFCCNNGHRNNILDPNHNQVSIGIATDGGRIYFVQDFIDNYINWSSNSPELSIANDEIYLSGQAQSNYSINQVSVSFDPPLQNMSVTQLNSTFAYGYGSQIAGVATDGYYYTTMTTLNADRYVINNNNFNINFNLQNLIRQNGAGEYTILIWLNNTNSNGSFVGATYTIFVNSNLQPYVPTKV